MTEGKLHAASTACEGTVAAGKSPAGEERPHAVGITCTGIAEGSAATGLEQSKPPTPSWAVAAAQSETLPPI